jgi:hypothetical protein
LDAAYGGSARRSNEFKLRANMMRCGKTSYFRELSNADFVSSDGQLPTGTAI